MRARLLKKDVDMILRCGTVDASPTTMKDFAMSEFNNRTADRSEYVRNNRDRFAHYAAAQRDKIKAEMVAAYGGKCQHCEITDPVVLCLDHTNDDAHVEKELYGDNARGGHKHYSRLKQQGWPQDRFQLLCYNCNAVKEHNRRRATIEENWGERSHADRTAVQAKIGLRAHNTSGFKGVFWDKQKSKWAARIMLDYKTKHLGFYVNIADAARAYKAAAIAAWGDNANVASEEEINRIAAGIVNPQPEPDTAPVQTAASNIEDLGL